MRPETEERVENLRSRTKAAKNQLDDAKKQFGENKDEYLREQIKQAYFWLDDVETLHLSTLEEDRFPPRTLAEESTIISHANFHLTNVALPLVTNISGWASTYGPLFQSIG